jgi:hypothetical protein
MMALRRHANAERRPNGKSPRPVRGAGFLEILRCWTYAGDLPDVSNAGMYG